MTGPLYFFAGIAGLDGLAGVSHLDLRRVEQDLRARVREWRALLRRRAPSPGQIVTKLLDGRLVFTPQKDRSWRFARRASTGKLLQGIVLPQVVASPTGFEPVFWP